MPELAELFRGTRRGVYKGEERGIEKQVPTPAAVIDKNVPS